MAGLVLQELENVCRWARIRDSAGLQPKKCARHATVGRWYDISNIVNKIIDAMTIMWGFGQGGAWTLVLVEN
ncbi:hypothetical protein A6U88_21285 [Agrobacterium sp. B131/95]|nr:hypothetical protein A6U88_21285 [Agrobacterium sp. B131/95]